MPSSALPAGGPIRTGDEMGPEAANAPGIVAAGGGGTDVVARTTMMDTDAPALLGADESASVQPATTATSAASRITPNVRGASR